ncbi:MAG: SixA phosphatase family protein, partial [Advenella sp.]
QLKPDLAIVSSATRTQQTWTHLSARFDAPVRKITEERIYEASVDNIVHVIRNIAPGPRIVLVVGHNPGLYLTTQYLAREGDEDVLERLDMGFPPASLTVLDFDVDTWESVGESGGTLLRFETPETMVSA